MKKFKVVSLFVLIAGMVVVIQTGCAGKAKPAKSAGFVTDSVMHKDPSLPFHKVWINPGFDKSQYKRIYVAPVNTSYMLSYSELYDSGMQQSEVDEGVGKLAQYTRDAVKKAFKEDPNARLEVLERPSDQPGTLEIEIALTQVVPSKVVMNTLGYAPFGIGLAIKTLRSMADDLSSVAFEARIRDAATSTTVIMVADRNVQQSAVISGRDFNWYSHAHRIIDNWAQMFVDAANRDASEEVEGQAAFTLKPW